MGVEVVDLSHEHLVTKVDNLQRKLAEAEAIAANTRKLAKIDVAYVVAQLEIEKLAHAFTRSMLDAIRDMAKRSMVEQIRLTAELIEAYQRQSLRYRLRSFVERAVERLVQS